MSPSANTGVGPGGTAIEPGKDHYVRCGGKLLGILLASQYPTKFDLEQARRDYERGVGAPVELSSRRSDETSAGTGEVSDS